MNALRHVLFRSSAFNTSEPRDYFINDCCYGDDVCRRLMGELRSRGIDVDEEPGQEDFGWYFEYRIDGRGFMFVVGLRPDDRQDGGDWMACIEPRTGLLGALNPWSPLKKVSPAAALPIHDAFSSMPEVSDIRWFADQDMRREENARTSPVTS